MTDEVRVTGTLAYGMIGVVAGERGTTQKCRFERYAECPSIPDLKKKLQL
jgi:hypothetical protein